MAIEFDHHEKVKSESLPQIPGGWKQRSIDLGQQQIRLMLPADPDAFVDDPEVLKASELHDYMPYWAHLWPASLKMARLVAEREWPRDKHALEIGCGIGLVGIAGMVSGLNVTFSDYDAVAVEVARANARANGFPGRESGDTQLDWRNLDGVQLSSFPVVLGSDVLYERGTHEPVLSVLDRLLTDDGICWLGDPGRQYLPDFCAAAFGRGYTIEMQDESGAETTSHQIGAFRLLIMRRESIAA